ncbi:ECF transporter S component [Aerococcaceae bacterium zg-BR9]|uniref:ECF transporter S component n=1 Tax=Aerococcaceae bacterium zg-1292 TaxID=2774330 RepID=UPI00406393CB|nr:ECF transporter S component [Aerococcaceae bacterium zg-BR9]MBF6977919.1 ECF transporter S component [Aerococcaceae bacterium zg-BR22]
MQTYTKNRTGELVRLALFLSLIIIQTWVPFLGNINIGLLSITFIHVTVIVATLWLGLREGVMVGTMWGLNSWIRSLAMPTSPLATYALSSPIVSVLPRILMPLIIGLIYVRLTPKQQQSKITLFILGGLGAILNTVLLLGAIGVFRSSGGAIAMGVIKEASEATSATSIALWKILGGIVVSNGIPEMIFSAFVTPTLVSALQFSQKHIGRN